MQLIPRKIEYCFEVMNHKMRSTLEHLSGTRQIYYYFDDKLVSEKTIPDDDFLTDDDCICEIVQNYSRTHTGMYADLFRNHSDKVHLTQKTVDLTIENNCFEIEARVVSEKDSYTISLSANGGQDTFTGRFKAVSFSEALEKTRILVNTLEDVSAELSKHISELSNDRVMALIKWN